MQNVPHRKFNICKVVPYMQNCLSSAVIVASYDNHKSIYLLWQFFSYLLTGFRNQMLNSIKQFSKSRQNGLFINSCFAHCQSERQDTWFADNSPVLGNKVSLMQQNIIRIWLMKCHELTNSILTHPMGSKISYYICWWFIITFWS